MKTLIFFLVIMAVTGFSPEFGMGQSGLDQRITELSQQISKEMTIYQKTTIAVVEFTDLKGRATDFGRFLSEELITKLYQTGKFKVIERQLLNKILAQQALSLTGVIEPSSAKQLGRILGVDAIASGTVTDLAQSLRVNARLISAETGEVFAVASTEIFKDESVVKLMVEQPSNSIPTNISSITPATSNKNPMQKVETKSFTFELKECKRSGTTLTCDLLITNNDADRSLTIGLKGGGSSNWAKSCRGHDNSPLKLN